MILDPAEPDMRARYRVALVSMLLAAHLAARPAHAAPAPSYLDKLSAVTDGAGKPIALGGLRGKVVVVDIWASWCAPCVSSLPDLQAIALELHGRGVRVVPVSIDRDGAIAAVRAYAREDIRALPLYVGPPEELARHFEIEGLPLTLVYDASGRNVARFRGARPWTSAALRRAIFRALATR
jgi:thiol-disulfide isomerase/thioredoxin